MKCVGVEAIKEKEWARGNDAESGGRGDVKFCNTIISAAGTSGGVYIGRTFSLHGTVLCSSPRQGCG
jgi:hypothetical protein